MLQRKLAQSATTKIARSFAGNATYIQAPGSGAGKDVTLIQGTYIGPEIVGKFLPTRP
jgi:hypothetical protein